jgi:hypothetical protein
MLERELADAKAEKARLLEILDKALSRGSHRQAKAPEPLVRDRILAYLEEAPRPRRTWQVWQDLQLASSPSRELSRLCTLGKIVRIEPGVFTIPGRAAAAAEGQEACCD